MYRSRCTADARKDSSDPTRKLGGLQRYQSQPQGTCRRTQLVAFQLPGKDLLLRNAVSGGPSVFAAVLTLAAAASSREGADKSHTTQGAAVSCSATRLLSSNRVQALRRLDEGLGFATGQKSETVDRVQAVSCRDVTTSVRPSANRRIRKNHSPYHEQTSKSPCSGKNPT